MVLLPRQTGVRSAASRGKTLRSRSPQEVRSIYAWGRESSTEAGLILTGKRGLSEGGKACLNEFKVQGSRFKVQLQADHFFRE
jgi:hypothetical protein